MAESFPFKLGDTKNYNATLEQSGEAYDLTGAVSVSMHLRLLGADTETAPTSLAMTVLAPTEGTVRRTLAPADLATVGIYAVEIVVNWGAGVLRTFPDGVDPGDDPGMTITVRANV